MEQTPKEEMKMEPRRRRKPKKQAIPMPGFLRNYFAHLGEDVRWYFDIRLWSPVILLVLILALALPRGGGKAQVEAPLPTEPDVTETQEATEAPTAPPVNADAAALARLADSVGGGRSDNVKTVIMWVAVNRSEDRSNGYGQSLQDEIERPNQWQGYMESAAYSEHTYEMALKVLETQATGGLRPVDNDMLWFVLNDDGSVTLRNQFTATGNQKWREKTVK